MGANSGRSKCLAQWQVADQAITLPMQPVRHLQIWTVPIATSSKTVALVSQLNCKLVSASPYAYNTTPLAKQTTSAPLLQGGQ